MMYNTAEKSQIFLQDCPKPYIQALNTNPKSNPQTLNPVACLQDCSAGAFDGAQA